MAPSLLNMKRPTTGTCSECCLCTLLFYFVRISED